MGAYVIPFDYTFLGKIGPDTTGSDKGHDLDQLGSNLLPYDPCKDAWELGCGEFLENG